MTTGDVIALLAALGAGGILSQLIKNVAEWIRGRKQVEREAWNERDREAAKRRKLEEVLHATRKVALDCGVKREDLPDWPTY